MTDDTATHRAPPRSTRAAVLIPFGIVTLVWGSTWLVIRDQVSSVPPSWSVCYRFLVAGLAMIVVAKFRRERFALDVRGWAFAAALGLSQFVLNFNFVYRAEEHITSGIVAVVFALMLVPNAVLARILLGQRMGGQLIVGSAVAMAGIVLLFLHEARLSPNGADETMLGIGFTLIAILCASSANILQATETARRYPMVPTLAAAMLIGAAIDAVVALSLSGPPAFEWRASYAGGIMYLALFGSTLSFPLYFHVIRQIGPAKAAYSGVMVPVIAMLLSTLFEGYLWSPLAISGALLAGAGLIIALRARRPNR
ncbi:multidrug transporter [Sphingomonas sp. Leaf357]|uniref:DMT family transporter n=1 Tax=Sphingomonas sp. Leaf357 TaxID=1736350 RepID=UPI0006FB2F04|nr:EamA family transporter [Sphingomonas sp. Leaf357]KQS03313.1 multidrug transporter [Sphingomonas sp. Leaf357]